MYEPQPLDVIVVDGHPCNPLHLGIMWRGLDKGCHCLTVLNEGGSVLSPEGKGICNKHLADYRGRTISAHRYIGQADARKLLKLLHKIQQRSKGYDFLAWLGFMTGLKSLANDEERWTCAELPYWLFHGNGHKLTPNDELFIYPRFFRFSPMFKEVYRGEI